VIGLLRRRAERDTTASAGDRPPRRLAFGSAFTASAVILVALFVLTLRTLPGSAPADTAPSLNVDVTGRQWFWDIDYPQEAGQPAVRTANELHIPVGRTVRLHAKSADVIHSLWIPDLNRKIDLIPGQTNELDIEADKPGSYPGVCAEFCGISHSWMGFMVIAQPQAEFDAWRAAEAKPAPEPPTESEQLGQQVLLGSACSYCHRIAGTNASGMIGPDLTHVAGRQTIGARAIPNNPGFLAGWVTDPQHFKPGNKMPGTDLSGPELQELIDYLESLK
jgi:cytochrome c oxidase subunit 2